MNVGVFNRKNEQVGTVELPENIFNVGWKPDLVHQALLTQLANRRKPLAHTKTRGEVRGGGRKPWRQKGTGRARVGSIRSPLWAGGGVTFGPRKEKIFVKKINRKMKQLALFSALSKKLKDSEIKIIDDLNFNNSKTRNVAEMMKIFFDKKRPSTIFIIAKSNTTFSRAGRNIARLNSFKPGALDLYNILKHKYLFIEKKAINDIINHYK
jgi:large subunit ribosomal protein L4